MYITVKQLKIYKHYDDNTAFYFNNCNESLIGRFKSYYLQQTNNNKSSFPPEQITI